MADLTRYQEDNDCLRELIRAHEADLESSTDQNAVREERIISLEREVERERIQREAQEDETAQYKSQAERYAGVLRRNDLAAAKKAAESSSDGESYFHHLTKLEDSLVEKDKLISDLQSGLRVRDKEARLQNQQIEDLKRDVEARSVRMVDVTALENKSKELARQLEEYESENRVLRHVQRTKTEAIEKLSAEVESRINLQDEVNALKSDLVSRNAAIDDYEVKLDTLMRDRKRLEAEVSIKQVADGAPVSMREWFEERRVLKADITRLSDTKARLGAETQQLKDRIVTLENRNASLIASVRFLGTATSRQEEELSTPSGIDNEENSVPVELYEVTDKALRVAKSKLNERDRQLDEKDEVLEALEKRVDVANKATQAATRKHRRTEADLVNEIEGLKQVVAERETNHKEKIAKLRTDNSKLQKRIARLQMTQSA
eukprot:TRINITY_DN2026_c0_g1_i2.p1 TRINITY_DN2026_c0_g1~~TRINITY_DN2026_c0_g1_i2.p1  ORF type:complete len:493 (+),score=131.69 TRINITY_DN2026_c0_g1_i2:179-1480(+)